jgi:hypothetical protein
VGDLADVVACFIRGRSRNVERWEEGWSVRSAMVLQIGYYRIEIRRAVPSLYQERKGMKVRQLGRTGPAVSAIGLGCMPMSGAYGSAEEADSVSTIRRALDLGI